MTETPAVRQPDTPDLPSDVKVLLARTRDAVSGALKTALLDTLLTEFNGAFQAMWNAPGDRAAAANLRKVDRTHRETAVQQVMLALDSQLTVIAQRLAKVQADSDAFLTQVEGKLQAIGGHLARLEQPANS